MKRTVITMDGNGELSIPSNLKDLWMSEGELVDMLHVTAMKLHAVIRSIYKDGLLTVSEVQQKQETSNGIWQTLYGFPMIVALCFRINSYWAARFRATIFKRLYGAKEKSSVIILQLYGGTTAFSWMSSCLLAWRCRTVVNKYWSISMTFLLVGGWVLFIKMTDKTPPYFCWIVEYDERSIEHQAFTAQHILNKSLNKRKIMLKRENHEHHSFLSFLPSNLLCRAICWEFVEGISGWFS